MEMIQTTGNQLLVSSVYPFGKAARWDIQPGDRIVSADGSKHPKLLNVGNNKLLRDTSTFVIEKQDGSLLEFRIEIYENDIFRQLFSILTEAMLLGIGWYAFYKKPESRIIRMFYILNVTLALCILALFSSEQTLSRFILAFCAIWLPYIILSFYLAIVFRTSRRGFGKLLLSYRLYSLALSSYTIYATFFNWPDNQNIVWMSNLVNIVLIGTILMLVSLTLASWKSFDRIERNQLLILCCGIFLSLMPYCFLFAIPSLIWRVYYAPVEYTLIGLIPFSGTITFLLVKKQMLNMRLYIPRLFVHSLYLVSVFVLFSLFAKWSSNLWAMCLFFIQFALLTYAYQIGLTRVRRKTEQRADWLEQEKLQLAIQLAKQQNTRDMFTQFMKLVQNRMDVDGVCLIWNHESQPTVYGTDKFALMEQEIDEIFLNIETLLQNYDFGRVIELAADDSILGFLCIGHKMNMKEFSWEEERMLEKIRLEAMEIVTNVNLLARLQKEYERNKEHAALHERQIRDIREYGQMLLEVQESQRIRTSYYLHDHLLQNLIFLSRDLEELHDTGENSKDRVALWLKCVYDSQRDIRSLCDDLYPQIIDKGDLKEAIQWLVRTMREKGDINIKLDYELPPQQPGDELIKTNLFRAIRELVQNVFKHSHASEMHIRLWMHPQTLFCKISDNGQGFDAATILDQPFTGEKKQFGLISVYNQIRHIGGETTIHSTSLKGTSITIKLPLMTQKNL